MKVLVLLLISFSLWAQVNTGTGGIPRSLDIPAELILQKEHKDNGYGLSDDDKSFDLNNHWEDIKKYYRLINKIFELDHKCSNNPKNRLLDRANSFSEIATLLQLNKLSKFDSDEINYRITKNATCNCEEKVLTHRNCIVKSAQFKGIYKDFIKTNDFKKAYILIHSRDHILKGNRSVMKEDVKNVRSSFKDLIEDK